MNTQSHSRDAPIAVQLRAASIRVSKQTQRLVAYAALALLDTMAIVAAFALASYFRYGITSRPDTLAASGITLAVYLGVAVNNGAFSMIVLERSAIGVRRVSLSLAFAVAITILAVFFLKDSDSFSRIVVASGALLSFILLITERLLFGRIIKHELGWRPLTQLIIQDGDVRFKPRFGTVLLANEAGLALDPSNPFMLDRLGQAINGCDRVIVACTPERRVDWARILKGANVDGFVLAPELDELGVINADRCDERAMLRISCGPLDLRSRALKRAFDIAASSAALLFLLPLFLLVAVAIKANSTGPVFFRQQRVGRGNRLFLIYKFRSMRTDRCDQAGSLSTQRDDDRITRVGRFLRASSIDELPQLLNVLLGAMSVVGPRPHALGSLAGDALFWEVDPRYWDRHATKPGITGLAQVRGFRGATHIRSDLQNRLQADLEYMSGWTIWRDFRIMLRTINVLVHKNAY